MTGEGPTRNEAYQHGVIDERERSHPRLRRSLLRLKRHGLGLAALLPAAAMAAIFVAEPFAGMQSVDQPTPPPPGVAASVAATHAPAPGR